MSLTYTQTKVTITIIINIVLCSIIFDKYIKYYIKRNTMVKLYIKIIPGSKINYLIPNSANTIF